MHHRLNSFRSVLHSLVCVLCPSCTVTLHLYVQCHTGKPTAQLGSSTQILQVCISEVELVVLAVRCIFLTCLGLNEHAEHARPAPNKLCLHGYIMISRSFRLKCFPARSSTATVTLQGLLSCMVHLAVILSLRYLPSHYFSCPLTTFVLQTGLAIMYANYWSLLSLLCRWLLTFQVCSSLHCPAQAPFLFQFQIFSMSRRRGRTMT